MLLKINNILNDQDVITYQQALNNADWQDGKKTAGHQARLAKNNLQLPEDSPLVRELGDYILLKLAQSQEFIAAALPAKIYPPMFNCYQNAGSFGAHVDNAIRKIAGTPVKIRSDLSMTLFISQPDDYEGGELIIEDTFGSQSVKLAAGDMLLYPSSSVHSVTPVRGGCRYAAFFWLQSMIKNNQHRRILYDLDKSIQALTANDSQNLELVRLTGVYHNLLREWAET